MYKHDLTRFWLTAGLVIAAASFPAGAAATPLPHQVPFCAPTATVCNTLEPGVSPSTAAAKPARQRVPFCAPTATVCNTLEPAAAPKRTAAPTAHW
jgi:hypothetical protein